MEYSSYKQVLSVVVANIMSYILVILKIHFITDLIFSSSKVPLHIDFVVSFLIICIPTVLILYRFKIQFKKMLLGIPLIFILVLIYSPDGFYFVVVKSGLFNYPNWICGIAISLVFFILQSISYLSFKGITLLINVLNRSRPK